MGTCRCGTKTVKFTPANIKKAPLKPKPLAASSGDAKNLSARSKRLSAAATAKAQKAAVPCNCTP